MEAKSIGVPELLINEVPKQKKGLEIRKLRSDEKIVIDKKIKIKRG